MIRPAPAQSMPPGACDCHMHFYCGPGSAAAPFAVPEATPEGYRALQQRLGLSRVVAVQSLLYGADNSCMLSAIEGFGDEARAIAVIAPDADEAELERLHARGVRGVRAFMLFNPVYGWSELPALARRIAPLGWGLQVQMDGREMEERLALLADLPCGLVIDHVGKFLEPPAPDDPAFAALRRLVGTGDCWVKLSAYYETSRTGAPDYVDVTALARILAADAPERMLWGSNWPHPNQQPPPDDLALLQLLDDIVPNAEARRRILVDNPAALFGFFSRGGPA